jgi:hypothetical protein
MPTDTGGFRCRQCKAFLPGNASRLKTGLRRFRRTAALPEDLRQSIEDFRAQLIADQGGLDELSAVRGGLIRLLVGAETAFRLAGNELSRQGGIHTPGGRLAFDRLLTASQTWTRIAEKLGIERRARRLTLVEQFAAMHEQDAQS